MQNDWAIHFSLQWWVPYLGLALHYNGKGKKDRVKESMHIRRKEGQLEDEKHREG